jgi:hypothetical protein
MDTPPPASPGEAFDEADIIGSLNSKIQKQKDLLIKARTTIQQYKLKIDELENELTQERIRNEDLI